MLPDVPHGHSGIYQELFVCRSAMVSSFVLFRSTAGLCSANGEGSQTIGSTYKGAEARDGGPASGEFVHGSDLSAVGGFEVIRKEAEFQNQGFDEELEMLGCTAAIQFRAEQFNFPDSSSIAINPW